MAQEKNGQSKLPKWCSALLLAGGAIALVVGATALLGEEAEAQPSRPVLSPEVHSDRTVIFRLRAPNAQAVLVNIESLPPLALAKDETGVWTVTTEPLAADLYSYSFSVDGVAIADPANPIHKANLMSPGSVLEVPGEPSQVWEVADVPRGTIHRHFYKSAVVGDERDFYVYTPPGYDPQGEERYPVLYLLHGYSDHAAAWTSDGRANVILDNLIAAGKARPMLIVMPLGYGVPKMGTPTGPGLSGESGAANQAGFQRALLNEVMPVVEREYRVSVDRDSRAIAGLSMGGGEAMVTGLNNLDTFAWVASFSGIAGMGGNIDSVFPQLSADDNDRVMGLWIYCGADDFLLGANRAMNQWLEARDIWHAYVETPGAHTWQVWRRNLAELAERLFQ